MLNRIFSNFIQIYQILQVQIIMHEFTSVDQRVIVEQRKLLSAIFVFWGGTNISTGKGEGFYGIF